MHVQEGTPHTNPAALTANPAIPPNCDSYSLVRLATRELTDADILSVLCDLFAGRAEKAFGEDLDWWAETFLCDISPKAAAGVVVTAISKWEFDRRAGAVGVNELKSELVLRARQLIARSPGVFEGAI